MVQFLIYGQLINLDEVQKSPEQRKKSGEKQF